MTKASISLLLAIAGVGGLIWLAFAGPSIPLSALAGGILTALVLAVVNLGNSSPNPEMNSETRAVPLALPTQILAQTDLKVMGVGRAAIVALLRDTGDTHIAVTQDSILAAGSLLYHHRLIDAALMTGIAQRCLTTEAPQPASLSPPDPLISLFVVLTTVLPNPEAPPSSQA